MNTNTESNYKIPVSGDEWVKFLVSKEPDSNTIFIKNNGREMLTRKHWMELFSSDYNFTKLCEFEDWEKLNGEDWISLMSADSRYVEFCSENLGWSRIDTKSLRIFLKEFPEYVAPFEASEKRWEANILVVSAIAAFVFGSSALLDGFNPSNILLSLLFFGMGLLFIPASRADNVFWRRVLGWGFLIIAICGFTIQKHF